MLHKILASVIMTMKQGCQYHVGCSRCMRLPRTNMIINPSSFILWDGRRTDGRLLKIQPRVSNDVCSRRRSHRRRAAASPARHERARALALRSHGHLHHDTFNKTHLRRRRRRVAAAAAAALDIVSRSVPIPQSKELSVVNPFAILFSRK